MIESNNTSNTTHVRGNKLSLPLWTFIHVVTRNCTDKHTFALPQIPTKMSQISIVIPRINPSHCINKNLFKRVLYLLIFLLALHLQFHLLRFWSLHTLQTRTLIWQSMWHLRLLQWCRGWWWPELLSLVWLKRKIPPPRRLVPLTAMIQRARDSLSACHTHHPPFAIGIHLRASANVSQLPPPNHISCKKLKVVGTL
jgi:hypothetical protein